MEFIHGPADIGGIFFILGTGLYKCLKLCKNRLAHIVDKLLGIFGEVVNGGSDHVVDCLDTVCGFLT